jgi:hypothetical protein
MIELPRFFFESEMTYQIANAVLDGPPRIAKGE